MNMNSSPQWDDFINNHFTDLEQNDLSDIASRGAVRKRRPSASRRLRKVNQNPQGYGDTYSKDKDTYEDKGYDGMPK